MLMTGSKDGSSMGAGGLSLRVETGECVVLSPEAERFKAHFRRIRPRSAKEVRDAIGVSDDMAESLRADGGSSDPVVHSAVPAADELRSDDLEVRSRAHAATDRALRDYVARADPAGLKPMEPAIAQFLDVNEVVLHTVALADIEVADGATLRIPSDTHLVQANRIVLHGTARLECDGFTKFDVDSIEGR
jgi:hypothetical protein